MLSSTQLALLCVIDQATVRSSEGEIQRYWVPQDCTEHYLDIDGTRTELYVHGGGIVASLRSLDARGLTQLPRGKGREQHCRMITVAGRSLLDRLRADVRVGIDPLLVADTPGVSDGTRGSRKSPASDDLDAGTVRASSIPMAAKITPTNDQSAALQRFADQHGRRWKSDLSRYWAGEGVNADEADAGLLRQVRNSLGSGWLMRSCKITAVGRHGATSDLVAIDLETHDDGEHAPGSSVTRGPALDDEALRILADPPVAAVDVIVIACPSCAAGHLVEVEGGLGHACDSCPHTDLDCQDCGGRMTFAANHRMTTCGGLAIVGARWCASCDTHFVCRRSRPADAVDWVLARGGRSLTAGGIKLRADSGSPAEIQALMARIVLVPELEIEVARLRALLSERTPRVSGVDGRRSGELTATRQGRDQMSKEIDGGVARADRSAGRGDRALETYCLDDARDLGSALRLLATEHEVALRDLRRRLEMRHDTSTHPDRQALWSMAIAGARRGGSTEEIGSGDVCHAYATVLWDLEHRESGS